MEFELWVRFQSGKYLVILFQKVLWKETLVAKKANSKKIIFLFLNKRMFS